MATTGDDGPDGVDVALVAYLEDGDWTVEDLSDEALVSLETITDELDDMPSDSGALALLSVEEDYLLLVRTRNDEDEVLVLLSDASAATDWPLARAVIDHLELPVSDEDQEPAGDLGLLADWGVSARQMGVLLDDHDLYPDEMLSEIAGRLGFGEEFDDLAGLTDDEE